MIFFFIIIILFPNIAKNNEHRTLLYDGGIHGQHLNFLYTDYRAPGSQAQYNHWLKKCEVR